MIMDQTDFENEVNVENIFMRQIKVWDVMYVLYESC